MGSPINSIGAVAGAALSPLETAPAKGSGFQNLLDSAIARVDNLKQTADQSVERFLAGEGEDLHSTVLAAQRAELSFELFLQVRNKVVQAYQEVMRMQM